MHAVILVQWFPNWWFESKYKAGCSRLLMLWIQIHTRLVQPFILLKLLSVVKGLQGVAITNYNGASVEVEKRGPLRLRGWSFLTLPTFVTIKTMCQGAGRVSLGWEAEGVGVLQVFGLYLDGCKQGKTFSDQRLKAEGYNCCRWRKLGERVDEMGALHWNSGLLKTLLQFRVK